MAALALVLMSALVAVAGAAPETAFVSGPGKRIERSDVVFWWVGNPEDPTTPILGYRTALDGAAAVFTTRPTASFFDLAPGPHRFTVAAIGQDFAPDPSPAVRTFTVEAGEPTREVEPNSIPLAATPFQPDTPVAGVSSGIQDVDWYVIDLPAGTRQATLTFRRPNGGVGTTTIRLYRGNPDLGTILGTVQATRANAQRVSLTAGTMAGVHYVSVQSDAGEIIGARYLFTVTGDALDSTVARDGEPNDSDSTANPLTMDAQRRVLRVLGRTDGSGDEDWFRLRVDVSRAQLLRMSLSRPGAGGETTLDVFAGDPPVEARRIGRLRSSAANEQFATFETGVGLGDLFLRVGNADAGGAEPYLLTLLLSEPPTGTTTEVEPNGFDPRQNPRSANEIAPSSTVLGTSWDGDADVDWFRIEIPRAGVLTLNLTRPGGRGTTAVRLFNPNFLALGEAQATAANGQQARLAAIVQAGAHYAELIPTDESPGAAYDLRTSLESPGIFSASHSATSPLRGGQSLIVTVVAPPGNRASFSIGDARTGIPLFDDGAHGDGDPNDGTYAGSYLVRGTDEFRSQPVRVRVEDVTGNESLRALDPPVTIDAVPPPAVEDVAAEDVPDDDGLTLRVRWSGSGAADLAEYRVYVTDAPLAATAGRTPTLRTTQTAAQVSVLENNRDLFVSVTAVDRVGNESRLGGGSVAGPVQALDNRLPEPIAGVRATDVPDDFGGQITVEWNPSTAPDFGEYRLYLDGAPIESPVGRTPALRVANPFRTTVDLGGLANGVPAFVAVTVLDRSGNESAIGAGSVAGPVAPIADVPPDVSPLGLIAPVGILRSDSATFFWNRFPTGGGPAFERVSLQLDGRPVQFVSATSATFDGLAPGAHTVRLSVPSRNLATSRTFHVRPLNVPEREPNDTEQDAETLLPNVTIRGEGGGDADWYRFAGEEPGILTVAAAVTQGAVEMRFYRDFAAPETRIGSISLDGTTPRRVLSVGVDRDVVLVEVAGDGAYLLAPVFEGSGDVRIESEPNDVPNRALLVPMGSEPIALRGASAEDGDVDWVAHDVSAARTVAVRAYRPAGATTTHLRIYRADPDAPEAQVGAMTLDDRDPFGERVLRLVPDTYFIAVESERASGVEYQMTIAPADSTGLREVEPNTELSDATPLPFEAAIRGSSWSGEDVDRYRVEVTRSGILLATLTRPDGVGTATLRLLNAAGTERAAAEAGPATSGEAHLQAKVTRGIATLSVEPSEASPADYVLSVFFVERLAQSATGVFRAGDSVTATVAWHPGGNVTLDVVDAAGSPVREAIPLIDSEGRGVYTGDLRIREGDDGEGLRLRAILDANGQRAGAIFPDSFRIDTIPPEVTSATHDAREPRGTGATVTITANAEPGLEGTFSVLRQDGTAVRTRLPLNEGESGVYTGELLVAPSDHVVDGVVRVSFEDAAGNTTSRDADRPLTLDTLPPKVERVTHDATKPLIEGESVRVVVVGETGASASFAIVSEDGSPFRDDIPLFDDGAHEDGKANDGVYGGAYTVLPGDIALNATVRARLEDEAGNVTEAAATALITLDASAPVIRNASHDARAPLPLGAILHVTVEGSPGAIGTFSILREDGSPFRSDLALVDDGTLNDPTPDDGTYHGLYEVSAGDDLANGKIVVALSKSNGKSVTREVALPLTLDTVAPEAVTGVVAEDVPNDEGGFLSLRWDPVHAADFAGYDLYRSLTPIVTVENLTPLDVRLVDPSVTSRILTVEEPGPFYFAVTARDRAGNVSMLRVDPGGSVTGAVEAQDNLAPQPIRQVLAIDRPNDTGRALTVSWEPSAAPDFLEYRLYLASTPFPEGQTPQAEDGTPLVPLTRVTSRSVTVADIPTPADETALFVAVTAVDASENESAVGPESASGPVQSRADFSPGTEGGLAIVGGPVGSVRHSSVAIRWARFQDDEAVSEYRFRVDGGNRQFTPANEALLTNLSVGDHVFSVEPADGSLPPTVRLFRVETVTLREREPNDAPNVAMDVPAGVPVEGLLADDADADWYRVQMPFAAQVTLHLSRVGVGEGRLTLFAPFALQESARLARVVADGLSRPIAQTSFALRVGEYLLRVSGSSGGYRFAVATNPLAAAFPWDTEPNDDPLRATVVPMDAQEIAGTANAPNDVDWYRIDVDATRTMLWDIAFAQPASGKPSTFELFQGLAEGSRTQVGAVTVDASNPVVRLQTGVRAGTFFVRAQGAPGVPYAIRSRFTEIPSAAWEIEPNGTALTATPLSTNVPLTGVVWGGTDEDWLQVAVTPRPRRVVIFAVDGETPGATVRAQVLNASLSPLGDFTSEPANLQQGSLAVPATGRTFYVTLRSDEVAAYRVNVLTVDDAEHDALDPLGVGDTLTVRAQAQSGWALRAEIESGEITFDLSDVGGGLYVGTYTVQAGDEVTDATVTVTVETPDGLRGELPLTPPVTLDTTPPAISEARHSGLRPLRAGESLRVFLRSEPGALASFDVVGADFRVVGDLFDDGAHEDGDPDDGLYAGAYDVAPGDAVEDGLVRVTVQDAVGNVRERDVPRRVTFDTTPPVIESVAHNAEEVLQAGDVLVVTVKGDPGARGTFRVEGVRESLPLLDNGTQRDETPDDGIYVGSTVILDGDNAASALVTAQLTDRAGNTTTATAPLPISIDTQAPAIDSVTHSADRPLRKGEKLIVRLTGETGGFATFDIGTERTDLPLFDDGAGDDDTAGDGVYTGSYVVAEGDDLLEAIVTARLTDANGNTEIRAAEKRVTLDAIAPKPVVGLTVEDVENDQGNRLALRWEPLANTRDFLRYQVYRQTSPIRSTRGLLPVVTELVNAQQTSVELDVPANNVDQYFAVTALDTARNESELASGSTFGPVQAKDDLPPAVVEGVSAADAPDDEGRALVVSWESENTEPDFAHYAVFVETTPPTEESLSALTPAATESDRTVKQILVPVERSGTPYYVAVAAADVNGNLSALDAGSIAGPIEAVDNVPPAPVTDVRALDAPSDRGGRLIVLWNAAEDPTIETYAIYLEPRPIRSALDLARLKPVLEMAREALPTDVPPSVAVTTPADDRDLYVVVVAVDGGGNRSDIDTSSVDGPIRSVANVLTTAEAMTIRAGFDARTWVHIPADVARPGMRVDILRPEDAGAETARHVEEANLALQEANIDENLEDDLRPTVRLFETGEKAFTGPVTVAIGFPPPESPELVRDLRLFRLNEQAQPARWALVSGPQSVDSDAGIVTAKTRALGVFRVARLLLPRRLDRVVLFPNPFQPERDGELIFRNLTREAIVEVFTLDARRVRRLANDTSGTASWDGRDASGELVASGLYLYLITAQNDRRVGQIFVIR